MAEVNRETRRQVTTYVNRLLSAHGPPQCATCTEEAFSSGLPSGAPGPEGWTGVTALTPCTTDSYFSHLVLATSEMICKTVARGVHGSYLLVGTRIHKNVSTTLRRRRCRVGILGNAKVMCHRLVGELPFPRPFPSLTTYSIGLIKTRRFLSANRRSKWPPVRPTQADRMS